MTRTGISLVLRGLHEQHERHKGNAQNHQAGISGDTSKFFGTGRFLGDSKDVDVGDAFFGLASRDLQGERIRADGFDASTLVMTITEIDAGGVLFVGLQKP